MIHSTRAAENAAELLDQAKIHVTRSAVSEDDFLRASALVQVAVSYTVLAAELRKQEKDRIIRPRRQEA